MTTNLGNSDYGHPPSWLKKGDKVTVANPIRWGLPLDFDPATVVTVVDTSFETKIGWTVTVQYGFHPYEIYETDLRPADYTPPALEIDGDVSDGNAGDE